MGLGICQAEEKRDRRSGGELDVLFSGRSNRLLKRLGGRLRGNRDYGREILQEPVECIVCGVESNAGKLLQLVHALSATSGLLNVSGKALGMGLKRMNPSPRRYRSLGRLRRDRNLNAFFSRRSLDQRALLRFD